MNRLRSRRVRPGRSALALAGAVVAAALPRVALAHVPGVGTRYDLPVPLWLYLFAAGGVVLLSFVLVALFVGAPGERRYASLDISWAIPLATPARVISGGVGIAALLTIVWAGAFGSQSSATNLSEYLVWIAFWAGLVILSGILGNLWSLVNPWSAIYDALCLVFNHRRPLTARFDYPRPLGMWPAVFGYLAFAWLELASGLAPRPNILALAVVTYSVITLAGMFLFGRDAWLRGAEAFSVLFNLVGRFAPVEAHSADPDACAGCSSACEAGMTECANCGECWRTSRARSLRLRPWGLGLTQPDRPGWDRVTFVILTLSTLAFDGIEATPTWAGVMALLLPSGGTTFQVSLAKTGGLIGLTLLFLLVFALFAEALRWFGARLGREAQPLVPLATAFAFTLIPIALVYNFAHNFSYLTLQGQQLVAQLSDPLGHGWNLFGTAHLQVNFALASAFLVWWVQVIMIVLGHVIAVYIAHKRALQVYSRSSAALLSQYPMLGLMVLYTMTSLWILAQPLTREA
ncbi:MAG: hypothetical protein ACYDAY_08560 [Candidatus Dormibacteria bacterium]